MPRVTPCLAFTLHGHLKSPYLRVMNLPIPEVVLAAPEDLVDLRSAYEVCQWLAEGAPS
ncbi:hydrogenase-1 operon protein HyaF [Escherichia coli]|uniref:Hydrogenase-1 operon protein HyaF n=1 Tax=Escherichia coli TaxID=562 RepID=A0A376MUZ2_ECOLX|nr:hydrogenase-1 operon protein HyaF [Escherichia coli]